MEKRYIVLGLLAIMLMVAGCTSVTTVDEQQPSQDAMGDDDTGMPSDDMVADADTPMQDDSMMNDSSVKTFSLEGVNYDFLRDGEEEPVLTVQQGDTVRITLTSTDGFHDWVVDEFDAATEKVRTGETTTVEFVADQKGMFEYYCSVGSHREQGMIGTLVVE